MKSKNDNNMKKILTIGGAMRDIFIQHERPETLHLHTVDREKTFIILEEGKKIEVQELASYIGGGAVNSAVSFVRLGFSTESFFKIGVEQDGDFILDILKKKGVSIEHVVRTDQVATGTSFIIPSKSGDRTVLVYRGANITLTEKELPKEAIQACDQLYITSLSGPASELLIPITDIAKKYNKPIATNPGTSQLIAGAETLKKSLSNIEILILNTFEAQLLMASLTAIPTLSGIIQAQSKKNLIPKLLQEPMDPSTACFILAHYIKEVLSRGPRLVVVTNGAEGVYVGTHDTIYFHPSLPTKVVSTLGAGDAFGSCFVAQIINGKSIEDALRSGIINSISVIEYLDTQTGLLDASELEKRLKKVDPSLLQTFPL